MSLALRLGNRGPDNRSTRLAYPPQRVDRIARVGVACPRRAAAEEARRKCAVPYSVLTYVLYLCLP